jgi:predicted metal-dependent hydrolase
LPAGERWFVAVFREALPLIRDPELRGATRGFMGQEAIHARAHAGALDYLRRHHVDPDPFLARLDALFARTLAVDAAAPAGRRSLLDRLATIAAIEHLTAVLGDFILGATAFDRIGADPVMLDLLRWHGAEEIEHRSVAHDVYHHLGGGYARRVRAFAWVVPTLTKTWSEAIDVLAAQDPDAGRTARGPRAYLDAAAAGLAPPIPMLLGALRRYLAPRFHPSQTGSISAALAYLERSPAVVRVGGPA